MSTKDIGNRGEEIASIYLANKGYAIVERNWKTRWCEIDIIAQKDDCIYFVEVKYRTSSDYGDALSYITPKKVQQMKFAAELWMQSHRYDGDCQLAALAVMGDGTEVQFLDDLEK